MELRRLLWRDLDPLNKALTIPRSKTEAGTRVIPLNGEAWAAEAPLKQSADTLGTYAPENFILHREWPKVGGTTPTGRGGWSTTWRNVREEAAKGDTEKGREKMSRLAKLRYYDLRHRFVTELCEEGVPEAVIRELAGHADPAMMRSYSHPRLAAKRAAVKVLTVAQTSQSEGSYGTNHVTNAPPATTIKVEFVE